MDKGLHYLPSGDTYAETKSGVGTGKADGMALAYGNLRYSSGTVTFKAAWVHDSRQLAFFGNGGTMTDGSMKDVTDDWTLRFINFGSTAFFGKYEYDTTWGTDVPAVSKTGYTFSGYYDSLSGGNRVYGAPMRKSPGFTGMMTTCGLDQALSCTHSLSRTATWSRSIQTADTGRPAAFRTAGALA